jgi:AraC family transcriptional regulator
MTDSSKQSPVLLNPQFITMPTRKVVGINVSYTCDTRSRIPAQWAQFGPHIGRIPGQVNGMTYGISHNGTPEGSFDYLCGVEVSGSQPIPTGMTFINMEPQHVAVFRHRGPANKIPPLVDAIFSQWLPSSGYSLASAMNLVEQYSEDFDPFSGAGWVDLCVPVKK